MNVGAAGEDRLREHGFHVNALPIFSPFSEEFQLPLAQQSRFREIDSRPIVFRIVDVIWSRALL